MVVSFVAAVGAPPARSDVNAQQGACRAVMSLDPIAAHRPTQGYHDPRRAPGANTCNTTADRPLTDHVCIFTTPTSKRKEKHTNKTAPTPNYRAVVVSVFIVILMSGVCSLRCGAARSPQPGVTRGGRRPVRPPPWVMTGWRQ